MSFASYEAFYRAYSRLPGPLQRVIFRTYQLYLDRTPFGPSPRDDFLDAFFDSEAEYERYVSEFESRGIDDELVAARDRHRERTGHGRFAAINQFSPARYYALVRRLRPETVVETGVCNGASTLCLLAALEANGTGRLYSVDLPDEDRLPADAEPGWIVPDEYRDRWELTIGRSQDHLPDVLADAGTVDLFVHDSLAMIMDAELDLVWPQLRPGGVVVADDIYASDAFQRWADDRAATAGHVAPNVGYMTKPEAGTEPGQER